MSLRKTAGLLAAFGLTIGLIGSGVGASFLNQVTGTENISTGTFACGITTATPAEAVLGNVDGAGYAHSVTYTAPQINSSAPGSAPFSFTVKNTGSINQVLTVAAPTQTGNLGGHFSAIPATPSPVALAPNATQAISTGIQWTALVNDDLGRSGSMTWTVNCGENAPTAIFDNTPAVVPGNLASYGPQAYSYTEWGGGVTFDGSARNLDTATVTMSSWACEAGSVYGGDCVSTPGDTYSVPITFTLYAANGNGTVGTEITHATQIFAIPYRPTHNGAACGGDETAWFDGTACFHGIAHNITFNFSSGTTLPNTAIFGITFNTTSSGYSPLGAGSNPTDSLNVAVFPGSGGAIQAAVGTWLPNDVSTYLAPRGALTMVGTSPVTNMPTGPADNFVGSMPAVQITATN